jgi:hypothetical protein
VRAYNQPVFGPGHANAELQLPMLAQCGQKEISSSVEVPLAMNNSRRSAGAVHGRDQSAPMPTAFLRRQGPTARRIFSRWQWSPIWPSIARRAFSKTAAAPRGLSRRGGRPLPPVSPKVATRRSPASCETQQQGYARISTFTSIPRKSPGLPMKLPFSGTAWDGSRVTATRMRLRSLTSPLVGSNGTHPAPGR